MPGSLPLTTRSPQLTLESAARSGASGVTKILRQQGQRRPLFNTSIVPIVINRLDQIRRTGGEVRVTRVDGGDGFFPADLNTLLNFACPPLSLTLPMVAVPF